LQIIPIPIEKEITVDDDLSKLILNSGDILDGDVLVIAQKIISKQEGRMIELSTVQPSLLAQGISSQYNKDPALVELILSESKRIVRLKNGLIIVETNSGFICANAGIDESNVIDGFLILLVGLLEWDKLTVLLEFRV
jgi:coenzyme F420-0:L-glutamate ligase/coenzyme F420-1:gamma-L-glutamate ligase